MEFIEGIEWIDTYITDSAIYVLERLLDLDEVREYSTIRNIIFDGKSREECNDRIRIEQENILYNGVYDVRIYCDETVRDALRFIGRVVGFVKIDEFRLMINVIIGEWIKDEERNKQFGRSVDRDYGIDFARFGNVEQLTFNMRRDLWSQMKDIGKRKGLNMEECLKLAMINFLERRYGLCRELLM